MMVKETTEQESATTDDSFIETVGAPPRSSPGTQHQSPEEPLNKSTSAKHKLKFTSSGTRLWRNISRKRSASHGSFKTASSNSTDELIIEDSDVILQDSVQLTNCLQTQQRYLFLLSNVLVLAKQKSSANFHVKDEIRLCEIWLSDCIDQVSEVVCDRERSFVIGWPTVNVVATFASIQIRDIWLNRLQQLIAAEKAQEWPLNVVIKIINTSQAFSVVKSVLVQNCEHAKDVVIRCVQEMHISSASMNDFQFWVQSEKENHPYPLIGHEFPYAIQMNYVRAKQGSSESAGLTDVSLYDGLKFQIVPKQTRSKLSMKLSLDETRRSPKKTSKIVRLFKKSSRSVEVGNIFGHHLSDLFDGHVLCAPVMDILSHLFVHGPATVDIFRKSAIVSKCHEAKHHLDQGDKVDFNDIHVGVSAALLKELLRCLPNCLLLCELYSKWIKISAVIDNQNLANNRLKSLVHILPPSHRIFLRYLMCILHRISLCSDHNGMTAYSLSICISPSLLWPRSSSGAALSQVNDAKKLNAVVEQMIECTDHVFGLDCLHLFDHLIPAWNQSQNIGANVVGGANNLSLDIVKEESLVGGAEEDNDSALCLQSTDITPTSACYDSGLATSNSNVSYNDLILMTALDDSHPSAEDHSANGFGPRSSLTPDSSVNSASRLDPKKCKFQDISGWFHLAFEEDTPFRSQIEDSYPAADRVCERLPEICLSGTSSTSVNLSAEFDSWTKQDNAGVLKSLKTSNTECSDKTESVDSAEPAKENADISVLGMFSSLDESWMVGLSMEQEVEKPELSSFEVEHSLPAVRPEANKSSVLNLTSVCSVVGDIENPSSVTVVSSNCQSLPSAASSKQMLSNSLSYDVTDSRNISRCKGRTGSLNKVEQTCSADQEDKRDEILGIPLSFKGILKTERTKSCMDSSSVESKTSSLDLRRGMTKCGSDIFPKYFLEGLHCTFGEVVLCSRSEEEKLTGKHRGISQTKSSAGMRGQFGTPRHAMVRPLSGLSKGHNFDSFSRPVAPCAMTSGHRVRPARPPSYAEAVAAKVVQNSFTASGKDMAGLTSHLLVMESRSTPSTVSTDRSEGVPTLPSFTSIVEYACDPMVTTAPTMTAVTCSILSHALQSIPSITSISISAAVQSTPSISSKPLSAVSTNSESVLSTGHCSEWESKSLAIRNKDMPNEFLCELDILQHAPLIAAAFVSSDCSTCSADCTSQNNCSVRNEGNQLQADALALMTKQRLNEKVRIRKRRQRSTDPKLRSCQAFGRAIGRSKSDSSEILEKKRQEYNSDEDKENALVPSNSFLKRKLAAMKQASMEEGLGGDGCSKCTVPFHLSMVSEENSACVDDAERESVYSPRDMKKKKSLLIECHNRHNEESLVRASSLHDLEFSDSLQHEMMLHRDDVHIKKEPLLSKTFLVSQPRSFMGNYCPSESIISTLHMSSEQHDPSVLKSSASALSSSDQYPYLFHSARLPIPEKIKVNWSVSKLKQVYNSRSVSQSDSVAYPSRMIALHRSPYFV